MLKYVTKRACVADIIPLQQISAHSTPMMASQSATLVPWLKEESERLVAWMEENAEGLRGKQAG